MELKIDKLKWKARFPNAGIKVEDAYEAVEEIRKSNDGQLSAEDILAAAKDESHVLHPLFEWNDTEAARRFRLSQASNLVRSFEITYKEMPNSGRRAYEVIHVHRTEAVKSRTVYTTAEEATADPENRAVLIAEAIKTLTAWRKRYAYLQELSSFMEDVDKTLEKLAST